MTTTPKPSPSAEPEIQQSSIVGAFLRAFWMFGGNVLLFFVTIAIFEKGARTPNLLDTLYWAIVVLLVLAKYLDVRCYHGLTGQGEPATMKHVRRYVVILVQVTAVVWGLLRLGLYQFGA